MSRWSRATLVVAPAAVGMSATTTTKEYNVDESEPVVRDNAEQNRYEVVVDGAVGGFVAYRRDGSTVTMTHTEVDSQHEGKGVGSALARGALDAVRAQGEQVVPRCSFIQHFIEKHREYVDVVPADRRIEFGL